MLTNKANNAARFHHRQRRNPTAEVAGDDQDWQFPDREPSPDEHAALDELVEQLKARFDPDDWQVVELSLLGYQPTEIADRLQRALRGVHRVRAKVREILENE